MNQSDNCVQHRYLAKAGQMKAVFQQLQQYYALVRAGRNSVQP